VILIEADATIASKNRNAELIILKLEGKCKVPCAAIEKSNSGGKVISPCQCSNPVIPDF